MKLILKEQANQDILSPVILDFSCLQPDFQG